MRRDRKSKNRASTENFDRQPFNSLHILMMLLFASHFGSCISRQNNLSGCVFVCVDISFGKRFTSVTFNATKCAFRKVKIKMRGTNDNAL